MVNPALSGILLDLGRSSAEHEAVLRALHARDFGIVAPVATQSAVLPLTVPPGPRPIGPAATSPAMPLTPPARVPSAGAITFDIVRTWKRPEIDKYVDIARFRMLLCS